MRPLQRCASGLFIGILASTGCKCPLSPGHCFNNQGDQTCGEGKYCDSCNPEGNGCVDVRPPDDCHYSGPEEVETGSTSDIETTNDGPTTAEPTTTAEATESSTGEMCTSNDHCEDPETPFCRPDGECVACDEMEDHDGACAGLDQGVPLCVEGVCVACRAGSTAECDAQSLLCDEDAHACVPCREHHECEVGACHLATGQCFPPEPDTMIVDVDAGDDLYTTLTAIPEDGFGVIVFHGVGTYTQGVHIEDGKTIALLAAPGAAPIIQGSLGDSGITVHPGTTLYVDGLEISATGNDMVGVAVNGTSMDGALAWLDRSLVVRNTGGGISATDNATLTLRSCFVGGADHHAAVDVNAATARISFSSLGGDTINATGLSCTNPSLVEVRSSIVVALGDDTTGGVDIACPTAAISFTASEAPFVGEGNMALGELPLLTPEVWFENYGLGDFHLQNEGLTRFADFAEWEVGDPFVDIDGAPLLGIDGTAEYVGADQP